MSSQYLLCLVLSNSQCLSCVVLGHGKKEPTHAFDRKVRHIDDCVQALKAQLSASSDLACVSAFTSPVQFEEGTGEAISKWHRLYVQWGDCQAQCDAAMWGTIAYESYRLSPCPVQL